MNGQERLKLVVRGNLIHCDENLCWLKDAEAQRKIQFHLAKYGKVDCANHPGVGFDDTKLGCDIVSSCLPACEDEIDSKDCI